MTPVPTEKGVVVVMAVGYLCRDINAGFGLCGHCLAPSLAPRELTSLPIIVNAVSPTERRLARHRRLTLERIREVSVVVYDSKPSGSGRCCDRGMNLWTESTVQKRRRSCSFPGHPDEQSLTIGPTLKFDCRNLRPPCRCQGNDSGLRSTNCSDFTPETFRKEQV